MNTHGGRKIKQRAKRKKKTMPTNRLIRLSRTRNNRLRQVVMTEAVILYAASFWVTTIKNNAKLRRTCSHAESDPPDQNVNTAFTIYYY